MQIQKQCLGGHRCRQRALQRQGKVNLILQGPDIDRHAALHADALKFLNIAATRLGWSARSTHRALKVARTIADLAASERVEVHHLAEAMQYRTAHARL